MADLRQKHSTDELDGGSYQQIQQIHHSTSKYKNANDSQSHIQIATPRAAVMPQARHATQQRSHGTLRPSMPSADELKACLVTNTQQQVDSFQQITSVFSECYERMKTFGNMISHIVPVENHEAQELRRLLNAECNNRAAVEREWKQSLEAARREKKALEVDLVNLKHKVSVLSAMPGQVSDAELKDQVENISQQAHSWVKTNFRKLQPPPFRKSALSQSSKDLLGLFMTNMHMFSQGQILKIGHAVVGKTVQGILGDFYFGLESDGRSGTILELSQYADGNDLD
jgi:hypothetical protein